MPRWPRAQATYSGVLPSLALLVAWFTFAPAGEHQRATVSAVHAAFAIASRFHGRRAQRRLAIGCWPGSRGAAASISTVTTMIWHSARRRRTWPSAISAVLPDAVRVDELLFTSPPPASSAATSASRPRAAPRRTAAPPPPPLASATDSASALASTSSSASTAGALRLRRLGLARRDGRRHRPILRRRIGAEWSGSRARVRKFA